MSNAYTLSTRTISKRSLLLPSAADRTVNTILYHGQYFGDVPADVDPQTAIDVLNAEEQKAIEYRAQFTDSEWARQQDEAAGG